MLKPFTIKIANAACIAALISSAPALAQLGGVTGSVGGAVNTTVTTRTPDVRVTSPRPKARIGTSSRGHSSYHYHGGFSHRHGRYNHGHFHEDDHSHSHGYARISADITANSDNKADKSDKIAELDALIEPLLTYGTEVESRKGKALGAIIGLLRSEDGVVTAISVEKVPQIIPVHTLSVDGEILVTSKSKRSLK